MTNLDLADIQGNIHRPYGRFGFPYTRHMFFHIADAVAARVFIDGVRPRVTTAEPWDGDVTANGAPVARKPDIALNIGLTFFGLHVLDLPTHTLRLFPDEFIDGMGCRAPILGDVGASAPENWNPVWHFGLDPRSPQVHLWVSLNVGAMPDGAPRPALDEWTAWLEDLAAASGGGVSLLTGHGATGDLRWQDSVAIMDDAPDGTRVPVAREHFGFTDGISDPVFRGQFDDAAEGLGAVGGGKIAQGDYDPRTSWSPLETGEFILGQVDEGQEFPVATLPAAFARNGTFMVWRKLSQDVAAFEAEMRRQASLWQRVTGITDAEEAYQTVCAKVVGRWKSGIPLLAAPTYADNRRLAADLAGSQEEVRQNPSDAAAGQRLARAIAALTGFRYGDDPQGAKCPLGAHIRRANPRDMLDPKLSATQGASTATNRRRILRRGLPYVDPDGEHGVIFMAICSSLFRQFEFIQQQWMNYGLDFEAGNDGCPLIGNREQPDKHVIPAGPANATTFIAADLPAFVTTRGGDYFFLPSLTALRMLAMGIVDPT